MLPENLGMSMFNIVMRSILVCNNGLQVDLRASFSFRPLTCQNLVEM